MNNYTTKNLLRKAAFTLLFAGCMLTTNFVMAQEQEVKQKFDCLIGYFGSPQEPIINGQSFCPGTVLNFSSCDEGGFNNANLPADVRCIQGKVGTYTIVATHQTTGVVTSAITTFTLPIAQSGASIPVAQLILTEPGCYSITPYWSYVSQCDPLIVKTISQGLNNNAPTTVCITAPANALPPIITRETPNPICANTEVCFLTDRPASGTITFSPGATYNFNDPNLTTNFVSYNTSGQEITRICYTYPSAGNYQVSRTNTGTCGGANLTIFTNVNVVENSLSIKGSAETNCSGFINLTPTLQCPSQIPSTFTWNFGDGTTGISYSNINGGLITHQYTDPNLATATVTVSANGGAPYTYIVNVITEPNINLQAAYSDVTKACSPQETYMLTGVPAGFTVNWTISGGNFTTPNNQATIGVNWTATENDPVAGPFLEGGSISVTLKNGSCEYTKTFDIGTCCATNQAGYININDKSGTKYTSQVPSMQAGTANNLKYYIDGELVIDNSLTLNNCVIKMGPYARILIKEPYFLTLNVTTISAGCDYMWEEILVDKGAILKVENGTRIEDGIVAINSVSGSEFHISNSFMNKNRTAIYVEGKQDNQNPSNITGTNIGYAASGSDPYNLFAAGVTYTSVGLRKPHNISTDTRVGIVLNFVDDITIGNPTTGPGNPQGLDNRNVFYQLMYGIESSYSNLNVYNNKFDKINFEKLEGIAINVKGTTKPLEKQSFLLNVGANPNGYKNVFVDCDNGVKTIYNVNSSIRGNKFEEVYKAISISNNTQGNSVSIRNNIISDANWGIYCYMNTTCNTQILNNNINFTSGLPPNYMEYGIYVNENLAKAAVYTIKANTITDAQYGIFVNSCFFPKVESNDVKLNYSYFIASNLKQETAGVTVKNCSGAYINCNTVSDFANNGYEQNTIRNNQLYASKGVLCVASPNSEIYDNNISKVVAGVDFNNTCTATKVYTNDFDRIRTGLLLQNAAIIGTQGFIPPVANSCNKLIAADNTFTNKATNRIVTDGSSMSPPIVAQSKYYYRPAANQTVSNAINIDYNKQLNGANLLSTQQVNSCRNDFGCVRRAGPINDGLILSEKLAKNQVPFADNDNKRKWIARAQVYQQVLNNDTLVLQSAVLQQFKDSVDLSTLHALNNARTATNDSARSYQSINSTLAVNNALASYELAEQLYQQVNNIRATALLADTLFNAAQQDSLRVIALLCPYTDGFAVFEARALLSYYDSVGTQYTNTCELAQEPLANRSAYNDLSTLITNQNSNNPQELANTNNVAIAPNPNQGSFTIISNSLVIVNVKVIDLSGRLVYQAKLSEPSKQINLNNTGLSTGVYIVQSTNEIGDVQQNKLFITEQ